MAAGPFNQVMHRIRQLVGAAGDSSGHILDGQLLMDFVQRRDERAFAALLERHGDMVLAACRRLLHDPAEIDDVFQATFLVLVRRASSIRKHDSVGSWLYGVACRLSRRLRTDAARRRQHEQQAAAMPRQQSSLPEHASDLRLVLDEELERLPEKYRAPLVLCYLEGKTSEEAAGQLGWPLGTLWGRLARARDLLRNRLTRRGVTLGAAGLPALLPENGVAACVPASLRATTLQAALQVAAGETAAAAILSERAASLTKGMVQAMMWKQVRRAAALVCVAALVGSAGLVGLYQAFNPAALAVPADPGLVKPQSIDLGKPVLAVAFAPRANVLAAITADEQVVLIDAATGKVTTRFERFKDQKKPVVQAKQYFEGAPKFPPSVSFSADGAKVSAGWDLAAGYRVQHEWDAGSGKELSARAYDVFGTPLPAALSADGKLLATVDFTPTGPVFGGQQPGGPKDYGKIIHLGSAISIKEVVKFPTSHPRDVNGTQVQLRQKQHALSGHTAGVTALAFAPDGKTLASASEDHTIRLWNTTTGKPIRTLEGSKTTVTSLAFAADGKSLAIAHVDGTVKLAPVP